MWRGGAVGASSGPDWKVSFSKLVTMQSETYVMNTKEIFTSNQMENYPVWKPAFTAQTRTQVT
jgi:hypothetical protein